MPKAVFFLTAAFALCIPAAAQLRVSVALVNVVATVTDDRGRYAAGLVQDDFIVEEDGVRQKIEHFDDSSDLPVSMGILIDSSGSMANKMGTAITAVNRFLRTIHEDDDIFLMSFSDRTRIEQPLTNDRGKLAAALRKVHTSGATVLYDAVVDGLKEIRKGTHDKKALLLISDGEDSGSSNSLDSALRAARRSEVLVYGLAVTEPAGTIASTPPVTRLPLPFPFPIPGSRPPAPGASGSTPVNMDVMNELADASGGRAWLLRAGEASRNGTQMERVLDQIAEELRSQYTIGYYPSHELKDGKWHRIEVRTTDPAYTVRARQDYFGQ